MPNLGGKTIDFLLVPMELRPVMRGLALVFESVLFVNEGRFYNPSHVMRTVVLYDLAKSFVDEVNFIVGEKSYTIKVELLNIPYRCNFCHNFGHIYRECITRKPVDRVELDRSNKEVHVN